MTDDALTLLLESPAHATLLRAYDEAPADSAADPENEQAGWSPRLTDVVGIDSVRLAPMHGKLIAHGLLSFQLTGRTSGVVYQVSAEGRAALQRLSPRDASLTVSDGNEFPADAAA